MTVNFLLGLSDNCIFLGLSPGRSKTYVNFWYHIKSCTWSLTVINVCDYWHFQLLVWSKWIALMLTHIIMSTVTYWEESRTWLVKHHIRTIRSLFYSVICFHLHLCRPDQLTTVSLHSVCWALIESKKCVSEYYERQIGLDNQKKNTKTFYCLAEYLLSVEIGFFFTKKPLRRNRGSLHSLSFSIFWIPSVKIKTIILPSRCSCKAESANVSTVSL